MIYKIITMSLAQTSTGKSMKKLEMEDTEGKLAHVNIFADFPHFADLATGSTIDGEIRKNDKGYDNLYSNEIKPRGNPAYKTQQMEKVMERKETSIGKFQDNKELSIKMASTLRMAVDMTIAMTSDQRENTLEETIRKWREWFWTEWDNTSNMQPF